MSQVYLLKAITEIAILFVVFILLVKVDMKIFLKQVNAIAEKRRFCMMLLIWTTVSLTLASATVDHRLSRDQGKCQSMSVCNITTVTSSSFFGGFFAVFLPYFYILIVHKVLSRQNVNQNSNYWSRLK